MYKCLIIDDEPLARDLIASHVQQLPDFEIAGQCENALKAYEALEQQPVDLVFLDIEMPLLKGTDFIKNLNSTPDVIITTAHRQYAIEGFELEVIDYLLKPITFERFFKSIEKFKKNRTHLLNPNHQHGPGYIFVKKGGVNTKVIFDEVLFVESFKDYVTIHLNNNRQIQVKHSISAFEKLLPADFMRVHKSFIINKNKITAFSKFEITIHESTVSIGESYRSNWDDFIKTIAGQ